MEPRYNYAKTCTIIHIAFPYYRKFDIIAVLDLSNLREWQIKRTTAVNAVFHLKKREREKEFMLL